MIGIIKTKDLRNDYLAELLNDKNIILSDNINDFLNIETLIIPPLGVNSDLYFKNSNVSLIKLYENNRQIKKIITGVSSNELEKFCTVNKIELIVLFNIEEVIYKNALLTSEGLIRVMSANLYHSLGDKKILILGYGYCAVALIKQLSVYNNQLFVYAKDYHDKKNIYMNGYNNVSSLIDLSQYDIIINTIPQVIIKKEQLETISKEALIYDIASYPYGFDLEASNELKIKINIIPGIPGVMLPISAAKVMYEEIKKHI